MITLSKTLLREVSKCASQLNSNNQIIQLGGIFKGFSVSLNESETYTSMRRKFREDDGIDRDGDYFLIVKSLF